MFHINFSEISQEKSNIFHKFVPDRIFNLIHDKLEVEKLQEIDNKALNPLEESSTPELIPQATSLACGREGVGNPQQVCNNNSLQR